MAYSYEVVRPFVDAEVNKPYEVGDIYPTDITDERITQLLHACLLYTSPSPRDS